MGLKRHIPNTITCCNLLSGCFSILFSFSGMPVAAAIMVFAAGLFDFLDGFTARLLDAHSPIGGDLDSLSDVVSFGVAPGFIMYHLMCEGMGDHLLWPFCSPSFRRCDWRNSMWTHVKLPLSSACLRRRWPSSWPRCRWLSGNLGCWDNLC